MMSKKRLSGEMKENNNDDIMSQDVDAKGKIFLLKMKIYELGLMIQVYIKNLLLLYKIKIKIILFIKVAQLVCLRNRPKWTILRTVCI